MVTTRFSTRIPVLTADWRGLDDLLSNRLSRVLDDAWTHTTGGGWSPSVNVDETRDGLILTAELPGLTEDDVEIELDNNVLTIRGEKVEETREDSEECRTHVRERTYGAFTRSFSLPRTVQADAIEATFKHGLLTVQMPKVPEAKGRKITVKTEG